MLNPKLAEYIEYPELRLLYTNKIPIRHPSIRSETQAYIRKLRAKYMSKDDNALEAKLKKYGNTGKEWKKGCWADAQIIEFEKVIYQNKGVPDTGLGKWRSIEFECIFLSQEAVQEFVRDVRRAGALERRRPAPKGGPS